MEACIGHDVTTTSLISCGNHAGTVKDIGLKYGCKVTCGMTFILTLVNMFNSYLKHTKKVIQITLSCL